MKVRMEHDNELGPISQGPPATPRDLQRAALRGLVDLARRCADQERMIEQKLTDELESAKSALIGAQMKLEQKVKAQQQSIHKKYEQRRQEIGERFETETSQQKLALERGKSQAELDLTASEREIKKNYDQQAWVAESVYEATVARAREDEKLAGKEHGERLEEIEKLEQQSAALLQRYNAMKLGGVKVAIPPVIKEAQTKWKENLEQSQLLVRRLGTLALPRMFAGVMPLVLLVLIVGFVVGGTWLVLGAPSVPNWRVLGIAGGASGGAALLLGVILWIMGRKQIRAICGPLQMSLGVARAAADRHVVELAEERTLTVARSKQRMEEEIAVLQQRYAPLRQQARENHAAMVVVAHQRYEQSAGKYVAQREKGQSELEQRHAEALKELVEYQQRHQQEYAQHYDLASGQAKQAYDQARQALVGYWHNGLDEIQDPIVRGGQSEGRSIGQWDQIDWRQWTPPAQFAKSVRFGQLQVDLKQITEHMPRQIELPQAFSLPASLVFPRHASMLIHTDHKGRDEAINSLKMMMVRLLTSLPAGRVRFTIIDPVGLGQNFAGFMHLADHDEALVGSRIWTESDHIEQRLTDLTEHMETVIQKYLRNEFETIDDYNAQAGELAEPYRFLVIADFPVGFEGESFRRLASIASSGARCGVYTLILRDLRTALPSGVHIDELQQHSINLVRSASGDRFVWKDEVFQQFPLALDAPPNEAKLTEILDAVGRHAKDSKRVEVPFGSIAPEPGQIWSMSSRDDLRVSMGRMGATRQQYLRLGRGVAQHALIAGKTGSGKSTLLHAIITNIALWYSPDEVEMYLVDFKKGVEFKTYASHNLAHARAVAVESDREFGLSVLQRIDAELTQRGELFRKAGVQDISAYRRTNPQAVMPRTLLIIDEFQEFFSEDDKLAQDAAVLLDRLVRQGRAFGIHLLLGSQTISGSGGLSRSTIGQMAVRIALQMSEADSQLILGDANSAARLLSRPGEAIYNDAGGLVEGNSPFQIAWLPDSQRDELLTQVQNKAQQAGVHKPPTVVFEGNMPAEVRKNELLLSALKAHGHGGEHVSAARAWLGEPVAIKDPTSVTLRHQSGANVLMVGQADEQAMALMASSLISLAAQYRKDEASFVVLDGTPADSPLAGVLNRVAQATGRDVRFVEYRDVETAIDHLAGQVKQRQENDARQTKPIFVLIQGLQRYRALRKSEEAFNFNLDDGDKPPATGKQFADILREGPHEGVHVICWCDTPASVERTLDRASLREFDYRVLFQMSASDSSNLIDSPAANKLGFYRALVFSEEQGVMEKFRPYALPDQQWLETVCEYLGSEAEG